MERPLCYVSLVTELSNDVAPGQSGPDATVQINPTFLGPLRVQYNPETDGDADPGEVVWTWVPYEENDGRGKDRPVLVVAAEKSGTVIALALTTKDHPDIDQLEVGPGPWDSAGRPSFLKLDRVFRVHHSGMRREACAMSPERFTEVSQALSRRYGWK